MGVVCAGDGEVGRGYGAGLEGFRRWKWMGRGSRGVLPASAFAMIRLAGARVDGSSGRVFGGSACEAVGIG